MTVRTADLTCTAKMATSTDITLENMQASALQIKQGRQTVRQTVSQSVSQAVRQADSLASRIHSLQ
jgi:hypothetical protein